MPLNKTQTQIPYMISYTRLFHHSPIYCLSMKNNYDMSWGKNIGYDREISHVLIDIRFISPENSS